MATAGGSSSSSTTSNNCTVGQKWLAEYADALVAADPERCAAMFHPGLAYIVNDTANPGSASFCKKETWEGIFSKVKFMKARAEHVVEPYPGHLLYHEVVQVQCLATGEVREGHFGDCTVVNSSGKVLLINRVADPAYFEWLYSKLA